MLKSVLQNPFIPIAFQQDHSGMQGKEYISPDKKFTFEEIVPILTKTLEDCFKNEDGKWDEDSISMQEILNSRIYPLLFVSGSLSVKDWWLKTKDIIIAASLILASFGVTKQLCNRLLEPFMYHTVIITATEFENFFALRCPQYNEDKFSDKVFRSRRDWLQNNYHKNGIKQYVIPVDDIEWLQINKGQAEIHMMALAEAMWDAYNESVPKELKAGEWHIPYNDEIVKLMKQDGDYLQNLTDDEIEGTNDRVLSTKHKLHVSSMMAARTSFTVVGEDQKPWDFNKYLENGKKLEDANPLHASPLEHCGKCMNRDEYYENIRGKRSTSYSHSQMKETHELQESSLGWSGNFRGFIQYRKTIPNENITK